MKLRLLTARSVRLDRLAAATAVRLDSPATATAVQLDTPATATAVQPVPHMHTLVLDLAPIYTD